MNPLECNIHTLEGLIFSDELEYVTLSGMDGGLTVYANHEPTLVMLKPSLLGLGYKDGTRQMVYISGGYAEMLTETLTIFADELLRSEEIDKERAQKQKEEAEIMLKEYQSGNLPKMDAKEYYEHEILHLQALAQLRLIQDARNLK